MQAQCRVQEIPHCIPDDVSYGSFVILSTAKDLPMQAQCRVQEISHCIRDDVSSFRHPEHSEGSPSAGTVPRSGDPSLHSG
ncbi:hypothetical protein [Legionella quateirensis]|uniref:Uncharacterized protein n=1 Tax=Legionella quateirensis TaxID=45072 RepID=A0A378KQK3_9GAMM|nr:hypothetical protein [Legionella quateirensis]KTD44619.1 hypothetical protein Lqua_2786 [Legionella quateirensis]STY16863.1 Uncharacterised protein [Legionella quateirensis]